MSNTTIEGLLVQKTGFFADADRLVAYDSTATVDANKTVYVTGATLKTNFERKKTRVNPLDGLSLSASVDYANGTKLFDSISGSLKYIGGVLAPNGKIYCVPRNATQILVIDPTDNTTELFGSISGTSKYYGGVLAPNGKIYCVPLNATQVLVIPTSGDGENFWALSAYVNKL